MLVCRVEDGRGHGKGIEEGIEEELMKGIRWGTGNVQETSDKW